MGTPAWPAPSEPPLRLLFWLLAGLCPGLPRSCSPSCSLPPPLQYWRRRKASSKADAAVEARTASFNPTFAGVTASGEARAAEGPRHAAAAAASGGGEPGRRACLSCGPGSACSPTAAPPSTHTPSTTPHTTPPPHPPSHHPQRTNTPSPPAPPARRSALHPQPHQEAAGGGGGVRVAAARFHGPPALAAAVGPRRRRTHLPRCPWAAPGARRHLTAAPPQLMAVLFA